MNREIKFRGKRLDNGEEVRGDLVHFTDESASIVRNYGTMDISIYDVIPESVGQYIGRCDRFKNEIYEGNYVMAWGGVGANGQLRRKYPGPLIVEYNDYNGQYVLTDSQLKESYPLQNFEAFEIVEVNHEQL